MGRWGTIIAGALVLAAAPAAAAPQAPPDRPIQMVLLDYNTDPAATPEAYVRELDRALAELAGQNGLPTPASVRSELLGPAAATVPKILPTRRDDIVTLGFSVGAGRLGEPGVADQEGVPNFTTREECQAQHPDQRVLGFRVIRLRGGRGYQCARESRVGASRRIHALAWIELDDRRLATASLFGVMGSEEEMHRILGDFAVPAMRLFEAQADAVFARLAPAP